MSVSDRILPTGGIVPRRTSAIRPGAEEYAFSLGLTPGGPGWGDAIRDYVLNRPPQLGDTDRMPLSSNDGEGGSAYRSGQAKRSGNPQRQANAPVRRLSRGKRKAIREFLGGRGEDVGRDPTLGGRIRESEKQARRMFASGRDGTDEISNSTEPSLDEEYEALLIVEDGLNPDGSFRASPVGAVGPAQIMPNTGPEAARLAGLRWDPHLFQTDRSYNETLGKAYYANLRRKYDAVTAAAAYNLRPSEMDYIVSDSSFSGTPFEEYLPRETRRHVRKFRTQLGLPDPDVPETEWRPRKKAWRPPQR